MARSPNTAASGYGFNNNTIETVWAKGKPSSYSGYKTDICGSQMKRDKYGKQEQYGWEIDHIKPVSKDGTDDLSNLRPLFWENNRKKADNYPWSC